MVITKDIKHNYWIWDLPNESKPWAYPEPYNDNTFICWKVIFNEFYFYCEQLTNEQAKSLLGGIDLQNGEQKRINIDKQKLIELGIPITFMSKNYHDFPERKNEV